MTYCEIQLKPGIYTKFDAADQAKVLSKKWYAVKHRTYYAASHNGGKKALTKMHRFILDITDSKIIVDHINHDTLDNRRVNLRICTTQQNNMNACKNKGLWPYKGIAYDPRSKIWYARIRYNKKLHHLGTFKVMEDAARAYNKAAKNLFGEFACINEHIEFV